MSIETFLVEDGIRLLRASGELDFATTEPLLVDLSRVADGVVGVLLDLSAVTFLDSAGVRLIDRLARSCERAGTRFRAVAPPGGVPRRLLEITGLAERCTVPDLQSGLAALRR